MSTDRPILHDIAERAGVSLTAVSMALRDTGRIAPETRERVKTVAAELGYVRKPRGIALKTGKSNVIGLIISGYEDDGSFTPFADYWMHMIRALSLASNIRGYAVVLITSSNLHLLKEIAMDGIILADPEGSPGALKRAQALGIPVVTAFMDDDRSELLAMDDDYPNFTSKAMRFLAEHGSTRPVLITQNGKVNSSRQAISAFRAWCREHGIEPRIIEVTDPKADLENGFAGLDADGYDGVFSFIGMFPELEDHIEAQNAQRIPPMPVVYYTTGYELRKFHQPTARLVSPIELLASRGIQLLLDKMAHKSDAPTKVLVKPKLEVLA